MGSAELGQRLREIQVRVPQTNIELGDSNRIAINWRFQDLTDAATSTGPERRYIVQARGRVERVLLNLAELGFVHQAITFNDGRYRKLEAQYGL